MSGKAENNNEFKLGSKNSIRIFHCASSKIDNDNKKKWYVIKTYPGQEDIALINLEKQGFETFCPKIKEEIFQRSTKRTRFVPVFPGYLFVSFDVEAQDWTSVKYTKGVRYLVGPGVHRPQAVPQAIMDILRSRCRDDVIISFFDQLAPGDVVRVNTGPLASRIARIESIDAEGRVSLLFEMMGAERAIKVHGSTIRPALSA